MTVPPELGLGLPQATREGIAYGSLLAQLRSAQSKAECLAGLGPLDLTHTRTDAVLFARLIGDIQARKPFSLVRLGDGEGNVLFWGSRRDEFPALARLGMDGIWALMFGRSGSIEQFDDVYAGLARAVCNADYLGIPFVVQDEHSIELLSHPERDTVGLRGTTGQAAVWDWISTHCLERIESGNAQLVNAYVHSSLPDYLAAILAAAGSVSLIGCYPDLLSRFVARFGVRAGSNIHIPPQSSNIGATPDEAHLPGRSEQIHAQLAGMDLSGELFLVGAGIAGKAYCDRIKRQGGMAIDAGSMFDVWMGIGVRKYHDPAFLAECRI